jgi:hypothetical protein
VMPMCMQHSCKLQLQAEQVAQSWEPAERHDV